MMTRLTRLGFFFFRVWLRFVGGRKREEDSEGEKSELFFPSSSSLRFKKLEEWCKNDGK